MPKFLVVETQRAEGCDYTIGCGVRITEHRAGSARELEAKMLDDWTEEGDNELGSVTIYEVSTERGVDLESARVDAHKKNERRRVENQTKAELAELGRLQKKYHKKGTK